MSSYLIIHFVARNSDFLSYICFLFFRKEKAAVGVSGGSPSAWDNFNLIHEILHVSRAENFENFTEESFMINTDV